MAGSNLALLKFGAALAALLLLIALPVSMSVHLEAQNAAAISSDATVDSHTSRSMLNPPTTKRDNTSLPTTAESTEHSALSTTSIVIVATTLSRSYVLLSTVPVARDLSNGQPAREENTSTKDPQTVSSAYGARRAIPDESSSPTSLISFGTPTPVSPPYFLSTLPAQTSSAWTSLEQNGTVTKVTIRVENTVLRIASITPSSAAAIGSESSAHIQGDLSPTSTAPEQTQDDGDEQCTRPLRRDEAAFPCFSFEPLQTTEAPTRPDWTSSTLVQSTFLTLNSASVPSMKSSPNSTSPTSPLGTSLPGSPQVDSTPSSGHVQVVTETQVQNITETASAPIMTSAALSPVQPWSTVQSDDAPVYPQAGSPTSSPETTAFHPGISNTTASIVGTPLLSSILTSQGDGTLNATMFPELVHTVTSTTTICLPGVQTW